MSHLLHPPLLDEVGLVSALRWYLDGLTKRSGIETSLEVDPSIFPRLPPPGNRHFPHYSGSADQCLPPF